MHNILYRISMLAQYLLIFIYIVLCIYLFRFFAMLAV